MTEEKIAMTPKEKHAQLALLAKERGLKEVHPRGEPKNPFGFCVSRMTRYYAAEV